MDRPDLPDLIRTERLLLRLPRLNDAQACLEYAQELRGDALPHRDGRSKLFPAVRHEICDGKRWPPQPARVCELIVVSGVATATEP